MLNPAAIWSAFMAGKQAIELSAKNIQSYGSQLSILIPGINLGAVSKGCKKCSQCLKIHRYYIVNDNYAQCIGCGKSNSLGDAYFYCSCNKWGFCAGCIGKGINPNGCDTKECAKCKKKSLKSYKFYGANFNYKNCKNCNSSIGLNCFYWYCEPCETYGYCYPCTLNGKCGSKG